MESARLSVMAKKPAKKPQKSHKPDDTTDGGNGEGPPSPASAQSIVAVCAGMEPEAPTDEKRREAKNG